jgi:predicted DNA-binding protein
MTKQEKGTVSVSFTIGKDIFDRINNDAKKDGRSISNYLRNLVEKIYAKKEK